MQKDPYLTPCEKLNSKEDALSEIEDKIGNSPEHICSGKDFLTEHWEHWHKEQLIRELIKSKYFEWQSVKI